MVLLKFVQTTGAVIFIHVASASVGIGMGAAVQTDLQTLELDTVAPILSKETQVEEDLLLPSSDDDKNAALLSPDENLDSLKN